MAEATKKEVIGELKLLNVRLSFADIFEKAKDSTDPETGETIKGKFKANFLMEKGTPETNANLAKAKKASTEAKEHKWGPETPIKKWPKLKPEKLFLRDGDLENWEGYEGCWYISANSDEQPVLIDRVKDENGRWENLTKENGGPRKLYAGAFVNAIVRVWVQDNKHGKRINCEVKSIQFIRKGEAFGGGPRAVDPNEAFGDDDVGPDDLDVESGVEIDEDDGGLV